MTHRFVVYGHSDSGCSCGLVWPCPTLDAAWAGAEAALPEGCTFDGVRRSALGMKDKWVASYSDPGGWFNFYGPTPAAACRALVTARLRLVDGRPA